MTATAPDRRSTRELDFLTLPLAEGGDVRRIDGVFSIEAPWAMARFGGHQLRGGWWALDWAGAREGEIDPSGLDVRLSSAGHPLVIAPGDAADTFRLHLEEGVAWDISILLSPWPGRAAFSRLKLRRLDRGEEISLLAAGVKRLMKAERPVQRLARAAARVLSGRTVGVNTAGSVQSETRGETGAGAGSPPAGPERIERDGLVVLKRTDQTLHPRAFELVAAAFARRPEARAIYADVSEGGVILPRPGWDDELAAWWDLAGTPVFLRAGETVSKGLGEADARATVAAIVKADGEGAVRRIALPLAEQAARHLPVLAPVAVPVLAHAPRVTAIIPTKFRVDLLEACLKGLIGATDYPDLDIIVVDNGCTDPRLAGVLEAAGQHLDIQRVEDFGPFNFPRLISSGAARATGEVLLLLNDDIQPIRTGWLHRMVESVMRPYVGAVGARLLFPDGSVQHAGTIMGIGGVCGHMWKGAQAEEQARNPCIAYPGQRMAVTGACLAARREAYDRVGGLDAEAFPVALNDIDFCLRLHAAGYCTIYRGDAVLTHHESQSRGTDDADEARRRRLAVETGRFLERWRSKLADDPFGSPAFDPMSEAGLVHRSLRRRPGHGETGMG